MYQYDAIDRQFLTERVDQYRDQIRRHFAGELSTDELRPLRLQNGLYIQRHGPMMRIAIPYGLLAARQLRQLAQITRRFDKGYGHFTTRHNMQLNWPKLEEAPDILASLAEVEMHSTQTSGNCIRNVTTDHFAGVAPDELTDPRPWCEIIRQWSTFHPEFSFLPRKFKIAVSSSAEDRAVVPVHDIGLYLVQNEAGDLGFKVLVGGGLGRTPILAKVIREFLPWQHILTYLEAIMRVYNRYGRRDNPFKARIKILVDALGREEFARQVEAEWQYGKDGPETLTQAEVARISAFFTPPDYETLPSDDLGFVQHQKEDKAFAAWARRNVHAHKVPGYAALTLSLKKTGEQPGDITAEQMEVAADLADRYSFGELRVSHEQNLILADVRKRDLHSVWQIARQAGMATANVGLLTDLICCPGGDLCALANARSKPVANAVQERFEDLDYLFDIGDIDLNLSGCINSCSHHHVGHIGILGVDKNNEEWYQITLGGQQGNDCRIGKVIGPSFPAAEVVDVIEKIIAVYLENRTPEERFIDTFDRIGIDPFKNRVYEGRAHGKAKARKVA